jgi:peptidoglycan/LPS O-acetylase OafA/YrhL
MIYRKEIDGLRAVAVSLVVLFHAEFFIRSIEPLKGGFIGVDIFFVISGYLITYIIYSDVKENKFSFANFYRRRIKRLFPALSIVLLFVYTFGWFVLNTEEFKNIGLHTLGGAVFFDNIIYYFEAGYFDVSKISKPLLHLWSLGIEEQFYICFPVLLLILIKFCKNNLISTLFLFLSLSLLVGHYSTFVLGEISKYREMSFYLLPSRFWELLAGAVLAIYEINYFKQSNKDSVINQILPAFGISLIIFSAILFDENTNHPSFLTVIPIVGTILVILFARHDDIVSNILSSRLFVTIGLISYPLYLWHWPILSYLHIVFRETPPATYRALGIVLSLVLAWLTYRFIEKPIRHGRLKNINLIILITPICVFALIGIVTYKLDGISNRNLLMNKEVYLNSIKTDTFYEYLSTNFEACLPKDLWDNAPKYHDTTRCFQSQKSKYVDIALIGDSHVEHLFPGLSKAMNDKNIVYYIQNDELPQINGKFHNIILHIASDPNIKKVVIGIYWQHYIRFPSTVKYFEEAFIELIEYLNNSGKEVYIVDDVPDFSFHAVACKFSSIFKESKCAENQSIFFVKRKKYMDILDNIVDGKKLKLIPITNQFCTENTCSMVVGNDLFYRDNNHLNIEGAMFLADHIAQAIETQ